MIVMGFVRDAMCGRLQCNMRYISIRQVVNFQSMLFQSGYEMAGLFGVYWCRYAVFLPVVTEDGRTYLFTSADDNNVVDDMMMMMMCPRVSS